MSNGEYPDLLRIVWQQWKFAFFGAFFYWRRTFFIANKNIYYDTCYKRFFNKSTY